MSYDNLRKQFDQEKIWIVEIDTVKCSRSYGNAPCAASGGDKCYNTAHTCQDRDNFDGSQVQTYRFCTTLSPVPRGLNAIPSISTQPSIKTTELKLEGGLGIRGGASITFTDHPWSDIGADPYIDDRQVDPYTVGTFWQKFRARNLHYQGQPIRVMSGFLNNGEYKPDNFITRHYIIEKLTVTRGTATIDAKDILKEADDDRAKYPKPSIGELYSDISASSGSFTILPSGEGDNYPASGYIRIGAEVMGYTRSGDSFTVTRGEYNTTAESHSAESNVQICQEMNDQVHNIISEILTVGAGINPDYISLSEWANEVENNYPALYKALLTEPLGVNELLKELGESIPHYLWWDEIAQKIRFSAVKAPSASVYEFNHDDHLIADSVEFTDKIDSRISQVWVYFAQRDPTKDREDAANYEGLFVRADLTSETPDEYGSSKVKIVYSRWIPNTGKASAINLAAATGRRFGDLLREIKFKLAPKNSAIELGSNALIKHPLVTDQTGNPEPVGYQITAKKEAELFEFTALEYNYSRELPGDNPPDSELVYLTGTFGSINLLEKYQERYGAGRLPSPGITVRFIVDSGALILADNTSKPAIETGSWPGYSKPIELQVIGKVRGRGGQGGRGYDRSENGYPGGDAIHLDHDLTILTMIGSIFSGGGGGGGAYEIYFVEKGYVQIADPGGGGGAYGGAGGLDSDNKQNNMNPAIEDKGGQGFRVDYQSVDAESGDGGDSGYPGQNAIRGDDRGSGGAAGDCIHKNGYTLTFENPDDESDLDKIRGAII